MIATQVGKGLVLAAATLSLVLAGMAFGIYSNRVDWPGTGTAGGGEKSGAFPRAKADLEQAQKAVQVAMSRWEAATAELAALEDSRPALRQFYDRQLKILLGEVPGPVQVVAMQGNSSIPILADRGLVEMRPASPPLKSRAAYLKEIETTEQAIALEHQAMAELIHKQQERTIEINGVPGKQKGLRDLVGEEVQATKNAREEMERLKPLRYNFQVESELLAKRQAALQGRLSELKSAGVALGRP